jgi:hypothetical protein
MQMSRSGVNLVQASAARSVVECYRRITMIVEVRRETAYQPNTFMPYSRSCCADSLSIAIEELGAFFASASWIRQITSKIQKFSFSLGGLQLHSRGISYRGDRKVFSQRSRGTEDFAARESETNSQNLPAVANKPPGVRICKTHRPVATHVR